MPEPNFRKLLTTEEAAAKLDLSRFTLEKWRTQNKGPAWIKVGGLVRYTDDSVQRYIKLQSHDPEAQGESSMNKWLDLADAAAVDIAAARTTASGEAAALAHLRDAWRNLEKAIAALEEDQDDSEDD